MSSSELPVLYMIRDVTCSPYPSLSPFFSPYSFLSLSLLLDHSLSLCLSLQRVLKYVHSLSIFSNTKQVLERQNNNYFCQAFLVEPKNVHLPRDGIQVDNNISIETFAIIIQDLKLHVFAYFSDYIA